LLVVAVVAPACSIIAGLGDYRLAGTSTSDATSSSGSGGSGGSGGQGGSAPGPLTTTRLSTGSYHACFVKSDKTVWCWGASFSGELGFAASLPAVRDVPIAVPGLLPATQVGAGHNHTCAILVGDHVSCWGGDDVGQAGDPKMPDSVTANVLDIRAAHLAVGSEFTCVITPPDDGSRVECWGNYKGGSLGRPAQVATAIPEPTMPELSGATAIATCAGCGTVCALVGADVWCWGGDQDTSQPTKIPGATDVEAIAIGNSENTPTPQGEVVFLLSNQGELSATRRGPASGAPFVPPTLYAKGVEQVAAGNHVAVVLNNHQVAVSDSFALDTAPPPLLAPQSPPDDVLELAAGSYFDCMHAASGVFCAGSDGLGQLGDGRGETVSHATKVASDVVAMSAGDECTTVKHSGGLVEAFGNCPVYDGNNGAVRSVPAVVTQLGMSSTFFRTGPGLPSSNSGDHRGYFVDSASGFEVLLDNADFTGPHIDAAVDFQDVVLGSDWDLALHTSGALDVTALTADANAHGLFGAGPSTVGATSSLGTFAHVAAAAWANHVCAWTATGALSCWGDNGMKQAAPTSAAANVIGPTPVLTNETIVGAAVGAEHTCALVSGGKVYCWGSSDHDQLGATNPGLSADKTFHLKLPTGNAATLLAAGAGFTCAYVDADQLVYCWGQNGNGQCGHGTLENASLPQPVLGLSGPVVQLAPHGAAMCARMANGDVLCWGDSGNGQVGTGAHLGTSSFVPVSGL
jgi:alpha-tubulin suppressor-like RCC1 family protein